jgi:phosphatidylglycerol:prolipoprotein diacylglycerol transferase
VHPIALQLGGLTVHWYGVLVALGFVAGLWTAGRRAPHSSVSPELVADLGPWLIVGAILGARLLYVISYWQQAFAGKPWYEVFMIHKGGLVFYGGLIGSSLATILFARQKKLPLWRLADVLAPSISLGQFFGRLGCLMNGCCFGRACELPWAIHFPAEHETAGRGVHPTQLYEASLSLALYAGLAALYRRKKFDGQVFATYLVGYALVRSFVELFRGDYPALTFGVLTPAHWVSVVILVAGVILWWKLARPAASSKT